MLAKAPPAPRLRKLLFCTITEPSTLSPFGEKYGEQTLLFTKKPLVGIKAE